MSAEVLSSLLAYDSMEQFFRQPMLTRLHSDFGTAVKILLTPRSAKYPLRNNSDSSGLVCAYKQASLSEAYLRGSAPSAQPGISQMQASYVHYAFSLPATQRGPQ
jgi:hypothetical protein